MSHKVRGVDTIGQCGQNVKEIADVNVTLN